MDKPRIAIISGSTRTQRHSHRVALYLNTHFSALGFEAALIDLAEFQLPMFEETIDKQENPPESLKQVYKMLQQADAMIFVSPEYNGGYTPALKNMVDHFPKSTFYRKPLGVVSVSTGSLGGMRGALQMQALATAIYAIPVAQLLLVPQVIHKFDEAGALTDQAFKRNIEVFTTEFVWLTEAVTLAKSKVLH
jgi:NAD(P)H-dependent FMN reductase